MTHAFAPVMRMGATPLAERYMGVEAAERPDSVRAQRGGAGQLTAVESRDADSSRRLGEAIDAAAERFYRTSVRGAADVLARGAGSNQRGGSGDSAAVVERSDYF